MEKFQASQLAKMVFLLILLLIIPFVSTSMRTSYLYFLLNILIVILGVEAGFLSAISAPCDERKAIVALVALEPHPQSSIVVDNAVVAGEGGMQTEKPAEKVEAEKVVAVARLKRVPSRPSIFFIGSCEEDWEFKEAVVEVEEVGDVSGQELFAKAEMFIGNFYNQLNMQREESWKKIHDLYHMPF